MSIELKLDLICMDLYIFNCWDMISRDALIAQQYFLYDSPIADYGLGHKNIRHGIVDIMRNDRQPRVFRWALEGGCWDENCIKSCNSRSSCVGSDNDGRNFQQSEIETK